MAQMRKLVETIGAFGLICLACTAAYARQPNILFAFADDWGRYASIYREAGRPGLNDVINTPYIDRIGREGVVFRHAFVASPSCTPSRAALVSGMHFYRNGRQANLEMKQ